jgi:hypothetical protein
MLHHGQTQYTAKDKLQEIIGGKNILMERSKQTNKDEM